MQRAKTMAKFKRPETGPTDVVYRNSVQQGVCGIWIRKICGKIPPGRAGSSPGPADNQTLHMPQTTRG